MIQCVSVSGVNSTPSIACENSSEKHTMWVIISVFNALFSLIILVEIIRLCLRFPIYRYIVGSECDTEFITVYLLAKKNMYEEIELTSVNLNLQQCVDYYKNFRANTEPKAYFEELHINLLIHTERARTNFQNIWKDMKHTMFT